MSTDAQDRRVEEIACRYAETVRVHPDVGPQQDRVVVACPDGKMVVIAGDGEILEESYNGQHVPAAIEVLKDLADGGGYDPALDALLVETCDEEWTLLPPWRCAMSVQGHLPYEIADGGSAVSLLEEIHSWHYRTTGDDETGLRVWKLLRRGRELVGPLRRTPDGWE